MFDILAAAFLAGTVLMVSFTLFLGWLDHKEKRAKG